MQNLKQTEYANLADAFKHAPMASFVKKLRNIGLFSFLALIVYYPILFFAVDNKVDSSPVIPLVIFWLPLLPAIRGLLQGNPYTYAWSNFVIMWCFLHGLTAIWTFSGNKAFIVLEIILLTLAFVGNTYFARYRGRELGMALPKIKELKEKEKRFFEGQSD